MAEKPINTDATKKRKPEKGIAIVNQGNEMKTTLLLTTVLALSGCAFSPVDKPSLEKYGPRVIVTRFANLKSSDGLEIAAATMKSIGFDIAATTVELSEIKSTTKPAMIPATCDCGSWNGNQISGTADSVMSVSIENGGTEQANVRVNFACAANFKGHNLFGATTRAETYQCASTGAIEKQFIENFSKIKTARGL